MKAYISFFRIRFINGLQYRTAAYAGIATQFAWGFMFIMLYQAFYKSNPGIVPMPFDQLSSYIWLQQAFLALYMTWFVDNDIFNLITSGNVSYELCRPLDIYNMWFTKSCAYRLSRAALRCFPILIAAFVLPEPYKLGMPYSWIFAILFIVSMALALIVVVAYCMLVYIFTFYTISPVGARITLVMIADFLSGGLIPLPLLPDWLTKYIDFSPFAAMQNVPFRIYSGNIPADKAALAVLLQAAWAVILVAIGKILMSRALKNVVVQGG
ncbi:MAG: ABC transporter permease [Clostridiales bacterium]|nr:ABC transporter permease [Clostridiales bacterium]